MRSFRIICLLLATFNLFLPAFLPPARARTLEAGIQHVELMPSVSDDLRPGSIYRGGLAQDQASNYWVKIPDWMAGTWQMKEETTVKRHDFKTGKTSTSPIRFKAVHKFAYGMQKDRMGGIWHYAGTPYTSRTRLAYLDEYHLVKSKDFVEGVTDRVEFRSTVTAVRVDPSTGKIKKTYQQESITIYRPVPGSVDTIELFGSTRSFDQDGRPELENDNQARIRRRAPFQQVDSKDGVDLKALFRAFLIGSGRSDLLPD
ncbi:MAG: hypothetical protein IPM23_14020 [Candidatus Melainabacteria bacterium]|nr:hypothetical protein [Candidatus Melainabacteria bacterium]